MKTTLICLFVGIALPALAEKVNFNQLPEAVQKAIAAQKGPGVEGIKINKDTKDGRTVYEVEFDRQDADDRKIEIAEDGTLLNKDSDNDSNRDSNRRFNKDSDNDGADYVPLFPRMQSMNMKDVPQPVQKTIQQQAAGRKVADIDKETWNGQTVYEVEFSQSGRNAQLHIAENGTIVKSERNGNDRNLNNRDANDRRTADRKPVDRDRGPMFGTQLSDLPTAVQATIKREAGNNEIVDIDKENRDGRVVYEVEIKQQGKNIELHVAEDGTIVRDNRKGKNTVSKL